MRQSTGHSARTAAMHRGFQHAIVAAMAALAVLMAACLVWRAGLRWSIFYNEGWNAGLTALWLSGAPLYHPAAAMVTNNYPPLSFLAVAGVMRLLPDAIFAGRLVCAVAFLAIVFLIWRINLVLWRDRLAALAGALVFAVYVPLNYDWYVATNDPQMLALALAMLGLFIIVRDPESRGAATMSAILFTLALFTKHNTLALPAAAALWLMLCQRRAFLYFAVTGLAVSAGLLLIFRGVFGGDFIASLMAPRFYDPRQAVRRGIVELGPLQAMIVLSGVAIVTAPRDRQVVLIGLYLLLAIGGAVVQLGASGIGVNAMFDVVIACALAGGCLVARAVEFGPARRSWAVVALAACAVISPGLGSGNVMLTVPSWRADQRARVAQAAAMIAILQARPGPALCENNVYCYWAGKPFVLDTFNFGQGLRAGTKTDAALARQLSAGAFGTVQLMVVAANDDILTPAVRQALATRYGPIAAPVPGNLLFVRQE